MAIEKKVRLRSNIAIPPGELLAEELEARRMTPSELASSLECAVEIVDGIMAGETPITREAALALENVLGLKAQVWLNLESSYRATKAEIDRKAQV